jgi:hypothetical protein
VDRGLIFGLIRLRSPAFVRVQINAATQVVDVNSIQRTIIPTPENRKVGSSTTVGDHLALAVCQVDFRGDAARAAAQREIVSCADSPNTEG